MGSEFMTFDISNVRIIRFTYKAWPRVDKEGFSGIYLSMTLYGVTKK